MQKEDGSRWNLFHLLDDGGNEHLAVIGEVRPYIWLSRKHIIYVIFQIRCAFQPNLELPAGAQRSLDVSLVFRSKTSASVTVYLLATAFQPTHAASLEQHFAKSAGEGDEGRALPVPVRPAVRGAWVRALEQRRAGAQLAPRPAPPAG